MVGEETCMVDSESPDDHFDGTTRREGVGRGTNRYELPPPFPQVSKGRFDNGLRAGFCFEARSVFWSINFLEYQPDKFRAFAADCRTGPGTVCRAKDIKVEHRLKDGRVL